MKINIQLQVFPFFLFGILPLTIGCNLTKKTSQFRLVLKDDYCVSNINTGFTEIMPSFNNPDSLIKNDSLLSLKFSKNEILVANATGMIPVIKKIIMNQNVSTAGPGVNGLNLRMQLQGQVQRVESVFNEIISELNCETERTKRAAVYLDGYEKKRTNNLTIAAILAGSATTVTPIIVQSGRTQNIIVIGEALISTYLGVKLLQSGHNRVDFIYERNLLSDIWTEPQVPGQYPKFLWQMMIRKEFNIGDDNLSLMENIKKRWSSVELNMADKHTLYLLFKKGGSYDEDTLQTRAALLGQLGASLSLLNSYSQSCLASIQKKLIAPN